MVDGEGNRRSEEQGMLKEEGKEVHAEARGRGERSLCALCLCERYLLNRVT